MDSGEFLGRPLGARAWVVVARPVERDTGKNRTGVLVALTDGEDTLAVSQIAYARRNSKNPDVAFEDTLRVELDKAQEAADVINETLDEADAQLAEAVERARTRVAAILDRKPNAKPE